MASFEKALLQHLTFLTAIRPHRNFSNFESLKKAADYIRNEFETYELETSDQKWIARGNEYTNIIGAYRPELSARLVVGAHYDVYNNQDGADDNTSGVAGLLVLAQKIMQEKPDLGYGIDFVSYCLEEPPFFGTKEMGSYIHAESLFNNKTDLVGMICLDMIGFFSDEPNSQHYPIPELKQHYPSTGNFIAVVGLKQHAAFAKKVFETMKAGSDLPAHLFNFPSNDGLAGLSDHRNYWYFGYDAVMINDTAKFRNPNYHQKTDTIETLDLGKMNEVVKGVYHTISQPLRAVDQPKPEPPKKDDTMPEPQQDTFGLLTRFFMWLGKLFNRKNH